MTLTEAIEAGYLEPAGSGTVSAGHPHQQGESMYEPRTDATLLSPGTKLAHWKIVKLVGRLHGASVYRVRHESERRKALLRVLEDADDPDAVARELDELDRIAGAKLPELVPIHEVHDAALPPFVVLEKPPSSSLRSLVRKNGPIRADAACRWARDVLVALDELHRRRVLHRDVRPDTITLTRDGAARLDACLYRDARPHTAEKRKRVAYVAPEVARGDTPGERSDLWSLGATLHFALTGRDPFGPRGTTAGILERKLRDPLPALSDHCAIGEAFDAFVARLVATDPAKRFESAGVALAAIDALASGLILTADDEDDDDLLDLISDLEDSDIEDVIESLAASASASASSAPAPARASAAMAMATVGSDDTWAPFDAAKSSSSMELQLLPAPPRYEPPPPSAPRPRPRLTGKHAHPITGRHRRRARIVPPGKTEEIPVVDAGGTDGPAEAESASPNQKPAKKPTKKHTKRRLAATPPPKTAKVARTVRGLDRSREKEVLAAAVLGVVALVAFFVLIRVSARQPLPAAANAAAAAAAAEADRSAAERLAAERVPEPMRPPALAPATIASADPVSLVAAGPDALPTTPRAAKPMRIGRRLFAAKMAAPVEAEWPRRIRWRADGAEMVLVTAGGFWRGSERPGEGPPHRARTAAFYVDVHEVTRSRFAGFLDGDLAARHTACTTGIGCSGDHVPTFWSADDQIAKLPVTGVSWHDAAAYAAWAGKRLPSEAEWEKAARGGDDRRSVPWGDDGFDSIFANIHRGDGAELDGFRTTAPVGSFPDGASPFGALDLVGNVAEWVADSWDAEAYREQLADAIGGLVVDPILFEDPEDEGVIRGGSFADVADDARVSARNPLARTSRSAKIGFRCVISVDAVDRDDFDAIAD